MAKRCEHCRFWNDTVFKGETPSGWGIWWGYCALGVGSLSGGDRHSLMFACERFQRPIAKQVALARAFGAPIVSGLRPAPTRPELERIVDMIEGMEKEV